MPPEQSKQLVFELDAWYRSHTVRQKDLAAELSMSPQALSEVLSLRNRPTAEQILTIQSFLQKDKPMIRRSSSLMRDLRQRAVRTEAPKPVDVPPEALPDLMTSMPINLADARELVGRLSQAIVKAGGAAPKADVGRLVLRDVLPVIGELRAQLGKAQGLPAPTAPKFRVPASAAPVPVAPSADDPFAGRTDAELKSECARLLGSRDSRAAFSARMVELDKRAAKAAATSDLSTLSEESLRGVRQRSIVKGDDQTLGAVQKELESRKKTFPENVKAPDQVKAFLSSTTDEDLCEMFANTPQTNRGYYRLYEEICRRGIGPLGRLAP